MADTASDVDSGTISLDVTVCACAMKCKITNSIVLGQYAVIREAVSINIHDKREKNPRIFLEFGVNI